MLVMTNNRTLELGLFDQQGRWFGQVRVESIDSDWVCGKLIPSLVYAQVEQLFRDFEDAVNHQEFTRADEIYESNIEPLGLQLRSANGLPPIAIWDVQIMNVSDFCCKTTADSMNLIRRLLDGVRQAS